MLVQQHAWTLPVITGRDGMVLLRLIVCEGVQQQGQAGCDALRAWPEPL